MEESKALLIKLSYYYTEIYKYLDDDIIEAIYLAPPTSFAETMYNLNLINKDGIDIISKFNDQSKYDQATIASNILRVAIYDQTKYKKFKKYLNESRHYSLSYKIYFIG